MTQEEIENNSDFENLLPQIDNYLQSQEHYIRALEMAVQLLQREVEHLRSHIRKRDKKAESSRGLKPINRINKAAVIFNTCGTDKKVLQKIFDFIGQEFSITDNNIYLISSEKELVPVSDEAHQSVFKKLISAIGEESILRIMNGQAGASVITNKIRNNRQQTILLSPLMLRGVLIGFYIALTSRKTEEISNDELEHIGYLSGYAAVALDNIRSTAEIAQMNGKLQLLNTQMLQSTKLASIGEISGSIAGEIEAPVQIMRGHIKMFESGVGDKKRRLQILSEQLDKISEITNRLTSLANSQQSDKVPAPMNLASVIDETLLFSNTQLLRDGIRLEREYESTSYQILGQQTQIEQVILNFLLNARDTMPDGGKISIGLSRADERNVIVNISDNGKGLDEKEIALMFDPFSKPRNISKKQPLNMYLARNIIEQHKGEINVFSELGKGTTIKLKLPLFID